MHIGVFFQDIAPHAGGGYTFQEMVMRALAPLTEHHQVTIFHYGDLGENTKVAPFQYHRIGGSGFSKQLLKLRYQLIGRRLQSLSTRFKKMINALPFPAGSPLDRDSRKLKVDLIYFPTPDFEWVDLPSIVTVWDLEHRAQPFFPEVSQRGEWGRRELAFRTMLERATYVITGTDVGAKEIKRFYGIADERIRLLPHPTPDFAIEGKLNQGSAKTYPNPYIFYPAQFWPHKNHVVLIDTIKVYEQMYGQAIDLVLVGSDKGNRSHIEKIAKASGLKERVHFPGYVDIAELIALYQGAIAMTYPSLCGPENLPPLEAFALGCPVIASEIPGSREQLAESAILVDPLSPKDWAEAIQKMRSSEVRQRFVSQGRKRASRYTSTEFSRDLMKMINEFSQLRRLWP